MKDGTAEVNAYVARLRSLRNLVPEAMPDLVVATEQNLRASIGSGTDPDGAAWKPKKDGGRPLVNAAKALSVAAAGFVIVAVISGIEAIHHHGTKKDPRRQMLPTKNGMPSSLKESYRAGLIRKFKAKTGAR